MFIGFFFYVRQKMSVYETQLSLLSDTVQTMAGITRSTHELTMCDSQKYIPDGFSDSESESDVSESESEHSVEFSPKKIEYEEINGPSLFEVNEVEEKLPFTVILNDDVVSPPRTVVSDDIVIVKKVNMDTSFDSLTLKELKEKVTELNGPKLKTKKDMIEFLQKNKI